MRRLRGDAVELEDLQAESGAEVIDRRRAQIEAPEMKTLDAAGEGFDRRLELGCPVFAAVEEDCSPAVIADLDELYPLGCGGNLVEPPEVRLEVVLRHADRAIVGENQRLEAAPTVTDDHRKALAGDREDPAALLRRVTDIEDAELLPGDIPLGDSRPEAEAR